MTHFGAKPDSKAACTKYAFVFADTIDSCSFVLRVQANISEHAFAQRNLPFHDDRLFLGIDPNRIVS